jgi:hypothetical protein
MSHSKLLQLASELQFANESIVSLRHDHITEVAALQNVLRSIQNHSTSLEAGLNQLQFDLIASRNELQQERKDSLELPSKIRLDFLLARLQSRDDNRLHEVLAQWRRFAVDKQVCFIDSNALKSYI